MPEFLPSDSYRALFDNSMDAVLLTVPDGRIIAANPAACTMFGMSEAELCAMGRDGLIDTTDPRLPAYIEERKRVGKARGELIFRRKDGSTFIGETSSVLLDNGQRAFVIIHDITERKSAEEALRASEERLRRAVSITTVGVLFFSLDGRLHDANQAFERMSGYTRRELVEMEDWMALTVPEFVGVTEQTAENLAVRGTTAPYEKQMIRKDGSRWWGLFAPTRLSGSGRESHCVEFIIDITRQKQAESALRDSEEHYRLLFENMGEGFALAEMIWDDDGNPVDWRYLEVNQAWAQSGVPVSEPVGKTAREVNPDIEPYWIETYGRVVQTGQPVTYENYASGIGKWFETFACKHSENRFALLFHDITAQENGRGSAGERGEIPGRLRAGRSGHGPGQL